MNGKDFYKTLGLGRQAGSKEIKEAYRRLAFQYHPDQNRGNPSAVEKMKEINEAYAVLSDPKKRKDYDTVWERYGTNGYNRFKETYSEQDIFRGSDINQIFEEMARAFGFRGFEEVFRESYGQGYRTYEFRRPGVFGKVFVFSGPLFKKSFPTGASNPSGAFPGYQGGLGGYLLKKALGLSAPQKGKDLHESISLDPGETQAGNKIRYYHRRKARELAITIPQGLKDGQQIRLKGMGNEGKGEGGPGDLYLKVRIKKPIFEKTVNFIRKLIKT